MSKGIIEQVEESQLLNAGPNQTSMHYLPHHAVVKQDGQTTRVRVVYDGSAKEKFDSPSLNDCLMNGPNYIPKLFNVLIRFRSYPIALTSDIKKAFLMIHVAEADRNYLRFLWFENPLCSTLNLFTIDLPDWFLASGLPQPYWEP